MKQPPQQQPGTDIRPGGRFTPGVPAFLASDSPTQPNSSVFEDDGDTGYFHACDRRSDEGSILDAVLIYDVAAVVDRHRESIAEIIWSSDGKKSALFINDYTHAVFDFEARRGYCRTDHPNFEDGVGDWNRASHRWDDAVMTSFGVDNGHSRSAVDLM